MGLSSDPMAEAGQGYHPQQVPIEAYGNGGFRFAGLSHKGSLLCLPDGMHRWDLTSVDQIALESFELVLAAAADIDVLLIGLGKDIAGFDPAIRAALRERKVIVEAIATGGAVRTYNILLGEQRAVAAALIAVDSAR
jgi:uncharacterized protein